MQIEIFLSGKVAYMWTGPWVVNGLASSVTILGNLLEFGQVFKIFGNN